MDMKTQTLLFVGIGAAALLLLAGKKAPGTAAGKLGTARGPDATPGKAEAPLKGCSHPKGIYTSRDGDRVLSAVRKWVKKNKKPWSTAGEIEAQAFKATRHVFKKFCPKKPFPKGPFDPQRIISMSASWENLYDMAFAWAYDLVQN